MLKMLLKNKPLFLTGTNTMNFIRAVMFRSSGVLTRSKDNNFKTACQGPEVFLTRGGKPVLLHQRLSDVKMNIICADCVSCKGTAPSWYEID